MDKKLRKHLETLGLDANADDQQAWAFYAGLEGDEKTAAKAVKNGTEPANKSEGDDDDDRIRNVVKSAVADAVKGIAGQTKGHRPTPAPAQRDQPHITAVKRYGRIKHFTGQVNGRKSDERAYRFGMWALATLGKSIGSFAGRFPQAEKFVADQGLLTKLHQGNVNTTGGYLIPDEFDTDLIDLREQFGVARRVLNIKPMQGDTLTIPRRVSGLTAYFVAEGAAGTESTKGWDQVRLTAKDLMVLSRMTNQLSEDAVINIGDDLAGEISYAFANKEDECAFNGDGTSTYGGIQGIRHKLNATGTAGIITQASGSTWGAITLVDLEGVVGKLPQYADTANASWLMHRAFYYNVCVRLLLAAGGTTATETAEGNRKARPLFLGYPVEFSQVYPAATASGHIAATLGDYTLGATFGDRRQDTISFSEHATVGGESVFERNEIAIRGTERFDINVHDVGDSSNAGPIVGIKTG